MKLHPDALNQPVIDRVFDTLASLGHIPLSWEEDPILRQLYHLPLADVIEITSMLHASLTAKGIKEWMTSPNSLLEGATPLWMLDHDHFDAVKDAATAFNEGTYV